MSEIFGSETHIFGLIFNHQLSVRSAAMPVKVGFTVLCQLQVIASYNQYWSYLQLYPQSWGLSWWCGCHAGVL